MTMTPISSHAYISLVGIRHQSRMHAIQEETMPISKVQLLLCRTPYDILDFTPRSAAFILRP